MWPKSTAVPRNSWILGGFALLNVGRGSVLGCCNTAPPPKLNSCTKGTSVFLKKKTTQLGPGAWREERIDFLSWSVTCCNHMYQGGTVSGRVKNLPHSITKLRTKAPRKTTGVVGVAWRKAAWAGKLPSHLFDTCCAQGNKTLYVYWLYYMLINYIKKTPVSVLRSPLKWNNLQGLGVLSRWLNPKWGKIFGLIDLMGFILQCRSKRNAMKVKVH